MEHRIKKRLIRYVLIVVVMVLNILPINAKSIEDAIVKVFTSFSSPNYSQPWQMNGQSLKSGSGCVISGRRILTNAHVVSDHTFVQVQRAGDPEKYTARVILAGHECDLAILEVEDVSFFKKTMQLSIGDQPKLRDKIVVYGFPIGGTKLSITEGVVSRIEMNQYAHSRRKLLITQIDAAINPGNSGGPVIKGGKIVGIAAQVLSTGENVGYCIPPAIIKHFLKDAEDGVYNGFPSLGIVYQKLDNPSFRDHLGMHNGQSGIIVNRIIYRSSAWEHIKKNDVILSIDDILIANDGSIPFGVKDRLDISYLIIQKYIGDPIKLEILRDKKVITAQFKMKGLSEIVPKFQFEKKPAYFIFGGLIFTPLSYQYLSSTSHNPALAYHFYYDIKTPEKEEIVVLVSVLADKVNFGYHNYSNMIVETVNRSPVADLDEFIKKMEGVTTGNLEIGFENNQKIVLDVESCRSKNREILDRYDIKSDRSKDLKK